MADTHPTPPNLTTPPAGTRSDTLWRHGAGVGAAVGTALMTCITVGQLERWLPVGGWPLGVLMVLAGTTAGAVFGALVGGSVPVAETKTDTQIGIH